MMEITELVYLHLPFGARRALADANARVHVYISCSVIHSTFALVRILTVLVVLYLYLECFGTATIHNSYSSSLLLIYCDSRYWN